MRIPIIGANWKMHKTIGEATAFAADFPANNALYRRVEVVIFPAFTALAAVSGFLRGKGLKLGAQNMHPQPKGAFTGEVSPAMLLDAGCSHVILGHSERRHIFKESNEFINQKVKAAFAHGLIPFLCIGETLEEKQSGRTESVCKEQLLGSLKDVAEKDIRQLVIAYEPVWAIGTGVNATVQDAQETIAYIRKLVSEEYGRRAAEAVRIQYGGSVKPDNAGEYFDQADIDGGLIGGAGLEIDSLYTIIKNADKRSVT
ncbi:MAG: triose-phosphate isomerase [Clostridia bacterium]|jgi:triosephosphate isomerase|nr:triose-phosphate isomerase [Clostridia bacterium]